MSDSAIIITRGEYVTRTLTFTRSRAAVDITGASISFVVRPSYPAGTVSDDTDAIISKTVGAGITITDGPNGVARLVIDETDTDNITYTTGTTGTNYVYEIKIIPLGADGPASAASGALRIQGGVVRAI